MSTFTSFLPGGIDEREVDWRHHVSDESRHVGLDENKSGKTPNASDKAKRRSDRRFDSQRTPFIWIKKLIFPSSLRFITDFISIRTLRQQIAQHVKESSSGEFFSDAIRNLIRHSLICAGLFRDIICVRQWSIWQISLHQSQNEGDNSNWNDQSYPHLKKKIFAIFYYCW